MSLDGPIAELANLVHLVQGLAQVPQRAIGYVAEAVRREIEKEFAAGRDPYGNPWTQLAPATIKRGRGAPPLTDTGTMRTAMTVTPVADGVVVEIPDPARAHQTGWRGLRSVGPARPIVPTGSMPDSWAWAIDAAIGRAGDEAGR
jgi:hypothetical protein